MVSTNTIQHTGSATKTRMQVLTALFAAVCAICSQLIIPIQPVPISLGSFAALMAGGFLGRRHGALAVALFVILGAAGAPVFSMMRGGLAIVAGPGGGFIIGYILMAWVVGYVGEKFGFTFKSLVPGCVLGTACCYALGNAWFMFLTGNNLAATMALCVFPFIPGDIAKCILASVICSRYRKKLIEI